MDFLPPTFVRDWRQLMRSKGYIILLILLYAAAWVIFLSHDWADVALKMEHAYEPVECHWNGISPDHSNHYPGYYPIYSVCRDMEALNRLLLFCALGAVGLLIPLRVGNAVAADTKVKGTNFLQVTPLGSWGIVGGMWLSAFSQVLVAAAIAVPMLLVRAHVMPTGNEADWYGLLYIVLAGAMFSAAHMFIGGLDNFLRFLLMVPLILIGVQCAGACADTDCLRLTDLPWWMHAVYAVCAVLITLLLLTLARRPYSSPAENGTLSVRALSLLCLIAAGIAAWGIYATGYSFHPRESDLMSAVRVLVVAGVFAALADALLPVTSLPVHSKNCLRGLPAAVQTPGVISSSLFLLLPLLVVAALVLWVQRSYNYACMMKSLQAGMPLAWFPLCCIAQALVLWVPVVLSIAVADFFCRRNSGKRPLVVAVSACALALAMAVVSLFVEGDFLPFLNIGVPEDAWRILWRDDYSSLVRHWEDFYPEHIERTVRIVSIAGAQALIALLLLYLRVRIHRTER